MIFRLGELYSGPGGIGLGARLASNQGSANEFGVRHVWATDHDADSCETYRRRFFEEQTERVIEADIREPGLFDRLREISPIDALAFGFPCNDFSAVGERKGTNGSYGPLYSFGVKALEFFRPRWFLAENVRGLHHSNHAVAFNQILRELEDAGPGYAIVPHLYKFEKYGVPQARHRIIIVGISKDEDLKFKVPSTVPFCNVDVSCRTALTAPPIKDDAENHEFTRQSPRVIERLKHTKPGENAFSAMLPDHLKLQIKGATLSQIYKRLRAEKPSYTITGSGGGGTHVYHWDENRALTNRERARLQTFPDDFVFWGNKESVRRQIGMAVPPQGAKVIFEAILKTFAGVEYDSEPQNILVEQSPLPLSNCPDLHEVPVHRNGRQFNTRAT